MGESVAEATITTWLKKEGDKVEAEESLVEIATDKVDSEVPAPEDGIIEKILIPEGEVAEVGQAIAIIKTEGADTGASPSQASAPSEKAVTSQESSSPNTSKAPVVEPESSTELNFNSSSRFYSPLVKNIAKKEGITLEELESIKGSGKDGRVTKKDILEFIPNRGTAITSPSPASASPAPSAPSAPIVQTPAPAPVPVGQGDEVIAMDRMRKLIADHMVMSKHTSPHVTSFVEADVTNIVNWRNKHKDAFQKREGEKITFTPIFIEAIVQAIKDFPMINVSIDGDNIIKKGHINIGLATALPSGNLIVPVIKDADTLNLLGITKKVNDLARRARENKLSPDEIQGGTYTLTNVGSFGNVLGTPIINQPQVAIMAVGAIQKKPAVIETPEGEFIGIRQKMYLSHSYDHRVVDGALGGMFVRRVADYLENFDTNKVI
jgi:2-oxoglutarate dehydrogenase E2 component (dihydrolipoamide succinyltransferase)